LPLVFPPRWLFIENKGWQIYRSGDNAAAPTVIET
jgi:hypothetical protein